MKNQYTVIGHLPDLDSEICVVNAESVADAIEVAARLFITHIHTAEGWKPDEDVAAGVAEGIIEGDFFCEWVFLGNVVPVAGDNAWWLPVRRAKEAGL